MFKPPIFHYPYSLQSAASTPASLCSVHFKLRGATLIKAHTYGKYTNIYLKLSISLIFLSVLAAPTLKSPRGPKPLVTLTSIKSENKNSFNSISREIILCLHPFESFTKYFHYSYQLWIHDTFYSVHLNILGALVIKLCLYEPATNLDEKHEKNVNSKVPNLNRI